jgi:IclR family pca regulon transcriptional regulator
MKKESSYVIESLQRGLYVLSLFNRERSALTLTEIVEATGLNKSTAFRVVNTLDSSGYLERDPDTRQYRPGLKVLQLGFTAISSLEFRQLARPYLRKLSEATGESASLGVLDDLDIVYVDRIRRRQIIVGVVLGIGSRIPAHCASMGKVILAHLPDSELTQRLAQGPLVPCTPNSKIDLPTIQAELSQVRQQGYAINDCELSPRLSGITMARSSPPSIPVVRCALYPTNGYYRNLCLRFATRPNVSPWPWDMGESYEF